MVFLLLAINLSAQQKQIKRFYRDTLNQNIIVVVKEDWAKDENILMPTLNDTIVNLNEQVMIFTEKELEIYIEQKTGKKPAPIINAEVGQTVVDENGVSKTKVSLQGERQTGEEPVPFFNLPNQAAIATRPANESYLGGTNVGRGVPSPRTYTGKKARKKIKKKRKVKKYKNDCPFFH